MRDYYYKLIIIISTFCLILTLAGCGSIMKRINPKPQNKKASESQKKTQDKKDQKQNAPKSLNTIESTVDKMIKDIEKVQEARKDMNTNTSKPKQEANKQQTSESDKKNQGNNKSQSKSNDKQSSEKNKNDKQQSKASESKPKTEVDWNEMNKSLKEIHTQWNAYEAQASKDGVDPKLIANFEVSLTRLSNRVIEKKEMDTLLAANETYQYIPDFLKLYQHKAPPETKKMKYYVQQILFNSEINQWDAYPSYMNGLKNAWEITQAKMEKKDEKVIQKTTLSIEDFEDALSTRNKELIKLKGNILLKNIQAIK